MSCQPQVAPQLEDRIRLVEDRLAIRELTARYNHAFSDGDAEAFVATYAEDGSTTVAGGVTVVGRDALLAACLRYAGRVVHTTTDAVITVDDNRAFQRCTMAIYYRSPDRSANQLALTGGYEDDLTRTADGWRFVERRVAPDRVPSPVAALLGDSDADG
jgi:uncharacterized protein (TIGR02246 family)